MGTFRLLEAGAKRVAGTQDVRSIMLSHDEVYGSLGETGSFFENTPMTPGAPMQRPSGIRPSGPAYFHTYGCR